MEEDENARGALDAHFREWQEASGRLHTLLTSASQAQAVARRAFQPILDTQEALERSLEPLRVAQKQWEALASSIQLSSTLSRAAVAFQESIVRVVSHEFESLQRTVRELPPRTREALLRLGDHGWYLDPEMPLPGLWTLRDALAEGEVTEAETELCHYFEGRLGEIEGAIATWFPHRARVIRATFNAHRREEYELSIPLLLIQTDGICKEVMGQFLFAGKNKKPSTAIWVEQVAADSFLAALLSPLAETLPISAPWDGLSGSLGILNRHAILHGGSLDYGNKTNGLKAVSLVNYVAKVLSIASSRPAPHQTSG